MQLLGVDFIVYVVIVWLAVLIIYGAIEPGFRRIAPALMTSVGILGTFLGIWIALIPFDPHPEKIQASIEAMLGGMKTAFLTSVLGLLCGILARWGWHSPNSKHLMPSEKKMIEELGGVAAEIRQLRAENIQGFKKLDGLAEAIKEAVIVTLEKLLTEIRGVIVEQLGKSMKELIATINTTMNETLGKKLGEFNQSVDQLRQWQMQHMESMNNLQAELKRLMASFREIESGIKTISENCAKIPATMEELSKVIAIAQGQTDELEKKLNEFAKMMSNFAEMGEKAKEAFPEVDRRLKEVSTAMKEAAGTIQGLKNYLETVSGQITTIVSGMRGETEKTVQAIGKDLKEKAGTFQGDLHARMQNVAEAWGNNLVAIAKECAEQINRTRGGGDRS